MKSIYYYNNFILNLLLIFNVLCDSYDFNAEINLTIFGKNASNLTHSRKRRQIFRGRDYYYQKGYDLNRIRYGSYNQFSGEREKPFFKRVNEVYSYYLPPQPTHRKLIKSYENFDDQNPIYGTKSVIPKLHMQRNRNTYTTQSSAFTPALYNANAKQLWSNEAIDGDQRSQHYYVSSPQPDLQYNRIKPSYRSYASTHSMYSSSTSTSRSASLLSTSPQMQRNIPARNIYPINSTYPGIPGWIRQNFPGYYQIPNTGFNCKQWQPFYGYFADTNAGCQVFHICQTDGRHDSFLCPNGTLFQQKVQSCEWWYHVDCPSAPRYYYLNARIGVLPPQPATLDRF